MSSTTSTRPAPALEGATTAPIITFDNVPLFGVVAGTDGLTLTATVHDRDERGNARPRQVVVAHLRGTPAAFAELRKAIGEIESLLSPPHNVMPN